VVDEGGSPTYVGSVNESLDLARHSSDVTSAIGMVGNLVSGSEPLPEAATMARAELEQQGRVALNCPSCDVELACSVEAARRLSGGGGRFSAGQWYVCPACASDLMCDVNASPKDVRFSPFVVGPVFVVVLGMNATGLWPGGVPQSAVGLVAFLAWTVFATMFVSAFPAVRDMRRRAMPHLVLFPGIGPKSAAINRTIALAQRGRPAMPPRVVG
jgi:hypothetical protein